MKAFPGAIATIIVAMALSSCSPAPEPPPAPRSTPMITPVFTSATTSPPGYIDCFGAPQTRPTELSLKCVDDSSKLVDITWNTWTPEGAEGRATLISPAAEPREVPVVLSSPIGSSFTDLTVDGELSYP